MSRPNCSDSASASTRRIRDSSTVWVNSLGAASTAVSSTRPSGRVRFSIAFCCGDRLVASRSRIWSQTVARSSVASAMPFVLPMLSTPGRVPLPAGAPAAGPPVRPRLWMPRTQLVPHRCPQAVHGRRRVVPGPAPGRGRRSASLQVERAVRAGERAVRRSVDRRGRPARRDPDVQRGATATLTAPSTARQRSGGRGRARRPPARPSGASSGHAPVRTMGGRDPPGRRPRRFLGYAGRSLWTVRAAPSRGSARGWCTQ